MMRFATGLLTRLVLIVLLPAPFLLASPSAATTVTFGPGDGGGAGNCFPWTCSGPGRYQQIYGSGLFSGPISIRQISFFNTEEAPGTADISQGNYSLHLSTTAAVVDALDSVTLNNNVGANDAIFFSGTLGAGGAFGSTFTIPGTAFSYNPANGNLLLDLFINSVAVQGSGFLDCKQCISGNGDASSRVVDGVIADSVGLVTQFSDQQQQQVPAPASLALLGLGLIAVATRLHRRR